jgi:cytochrome b6-f complex iron-sulfur subunit
LNAENKFKCPCHGSGFRRTGINFEGPAPRPLERVKIVLADDGQLAIDKSVLFRSEKGEWTKPEAFLKLKA